MSLDVFRNVPIVYADPVCLLAHRPVRGMACRAPYGATSYLSVWPHLPMSMLI